MNSVLLKIKSLYNDMGRGEKKIADWILQNPDNIISLSISDMADMCGCGEATIVRFSRRLGLSGYQDLKLTIAQESGSAAPIADKSINKDDKGIEIFSKLCTDIASSLEYTKKVLNNDAFEKAAHLICNADRIAVFGLGSSSSVAMDAQHKFMRAGLNATAYCDNHLQAITASHLGKNDAAIGISHSGSSKDIVEALRISGESGAATICITNLGKSPITKESDVALYTASEETKHNILGLHSRIAQLAIIDALYVYAVLNGGGKTAAAIQKTEKALRGKKY